MAGDLSVMLQPSPPLPWCAFDQTGGRQEWRGGLGTNVTAFACPDGRGDAALNSHADRGLSACCRSGRETSTVDRRRLIRALPRRTTAGVAALVAAALSITLLVPQWDGEDDPVESKPAKAAGAIDEDAAQDQAVRTSKRVEVTALRDATSTTYALPSGQFELTAHAAPVRAKVGADWKPIDTTLTRTEDGWAPKAAADPVVFSAGSGKKTGTDSTGNAQRVSYRVSSAARTDGLAAAGAKVSYSDLVTFKSAGHEVTVGWPGSLPVPVISGASALYRSVFDGVDLLLTARDSGFSHVLIVHSPAAAANAQIAVMPYRLTSPDLTFHLDPVSRVVTAKDGAGAEIAVSPTPFMWDSAGTPAVTQGEDPQPAEPSDLPSPSYSEEPGAPPSDPAGTGAEDTPDPTPPPAAPGSSASVSPPPSAPQQSPSSAESAQQSARGADKNSRSSGVNHAAYLSEATAPLSTTDVLTLPGLSGPQAGAHTAVGDADLAGQGTTSAILTVTPDRSLLTDADTVWPAFVDPSITGKTQNWTTVYDRHPDSSFYDGANFNSGTTEARVGFESTTMGMSRSYFRLGWATSFKGATVTKANIRLLETYSWSCSARPMELHYTDGITSRTTWNNPATFRKLIDTSKSFAHGWSSTCPDSYVSYNGKAIAQDAADGGWTGFTIGLKASADDERDRDQYAWKKFKAEGEAAPKIIIEYNRRPLPPTSLTMTPGPDCDLLPAYTSVGKSDLTFAAASSDPDNTPTYLDLKYLDFEVWKSGSTTKFTDVNRPVDSAGRASQTHLSGQFVNGQIYFWRVRAIDSTGAASGYSRTCGFTYDESAPNPPKVSSTAFPEDDGKGNVWSTVKLGTGGIFTFSTDASTDTVKYVYSFNNGNYDKSVSITGPDTNTPVLNPPFAGPNVLYVKSVDAAGNASAAPTKYLFYVKPRDTGDAPGDVNGDTRPDLLAVDAAGNLSSYPGGSNGDVHIHAQGAHDSGALLPDGYWLGSNGKPALISHTADWYPGDGITDLLARMPDGKLYTYPGDGYGSFDISRRLEVHLPAGAPIPATLTQLITTRDITGDKLPDAFALAGNQLWAFTGYTGASFTGARMLSADSWSLRDLISADDITGDGVADLLFRTEEVGRGLLLRHGKPAAGGGVSLDSLAVAASSGTTKDEVYGTNNWGRANIPRLRGTPDTTGDGIPDFWAVMSDGSLYLYSGGRTEHGARYLVGERGWTGLRTLG